ncbi:hypothetical protein, conserved [Eimeria brunetti]|uniref:Regulator of chromosome condensation domain-containing protein n=1 Tax=Eimeria brunetti TaxID=51314 RepID=U6LHL8_9EIME|nr:hypothetical protein, conserved [Eimeria brunetti]
MGWGQRDRGEPLVEVLLPGHTGAVSFAVGGSAMVATLDGKLFGAPLSGPHLERNDLTGFSLHEIIPEPVEVSSVPMNDFTRHCRRSEDLGIPLALGDKAAHRPAMHAHTDSHPRFVKVAAGRQHFAALTSHGVLYTWGRGGSWGGGSPLGHGDAKHRYRPTLVGQFINAREFVVDVACGTASTCVVTSSGRVFSSGAADFGVNGSGMLLSSRLFKELEFFQGVLSPSLVEAKRRLEEEQLQQLENLRKEMEEDGVKRSHLLSRPFEASPDASENADRDKTNAGSRSPSDFVSSRLKLPKVMCETYHCGLLTPEGALWLWGRNDCLQLSRAKPVMASGGESNYPILAEFFVRADVPLDSCAVGSCHSVALAKNGAVYEWGGPNAEPPHTVDLHWQYPGSIFKSPIRKVVAGGFSSSTGFSAALTEEGEAYFWGPGAVKMPLGLKATKGQTLEQLRLPLGIEESGDHHSSGKQLVADIFAGQQGCVLVTTGSL